ncbi:hypothetical protein QVN85_12230 [Oscillibacter valericigenes]|nr:hypothetical protein [Oscillibacter valericigenes]
MNVQSVPKAEYEKTMIRQTNKINLKEILLSLLATIAVAAYPSLFMYFSNSKEGHLTEIAQPLIWSMATAAVLFFGAMLIVHSMYKASIIISLFLLVLLNYTPLESGVQAILPRLKYWHILPVFIVICCTLHGLFGRKFLQIWEKS